MRTDIYAELKKRIIHGTYAQGEIIREADIAEEFNVSRTPIREVFQNLQYDKLITLLPFRGAQITFIELEFFFQTVAVKQNLDELATRLAARWATEEDIKRLKKIAQECLKWNPQKDFDEMLEIDTEFHRAIRAISRNKVLAETTEQLQVHVDRYYYYARYVSSRTMDHFAEEYEAIIKAIESHDEKAAGAAIVAHLENYYYFIQKRFAD